MTDAVTMDLKAAGNALVLVGTTDGELGGSRWLGEAGERATPPAVDLDGARKVHQAVATAIAAGQVRSCHDLSEGGLAVAAAEMALAGGIGMTLSLADQPCAGEGTNADAVRMFAETPTRYLLEVAPEQWEALASTLAEVRHAKIGEACGDRLTIRGGQGEYEWSLSDLTASFRTGLGL